MNVLRLHPIVHLCFIRSISHLIVILFYLGLLIISNPTFNDVLDKSDQLGALIAEYTAAPFGKDEPWVEELINNKVGLLHLIFVGLPACFVFLYIEVSGRVQHWRHCVRTFIVVHAIPLLLLTGWIFWPRTMSGVYKGQMDAIGEVIKHFGYHGTYTLFKIGMPPHMHIIVYIEVLIVWSLTSGLIRHCIHRWRGD